MVKFGIKTAKHNFITLYLTEKNKLVFEKFLENIQEDTDMLNLSKNPKHIISVSTVQLYHEYNLKRKKIRDEKSNQT